ncbi:MAG: hypothetical protein F6K63_12165 [Moorea sp. SIO1G6]|uniref:hypothetical protein n=1 Tax=Moorena sp. SIO1G6 TaxID=2607840 RepID=UPI0013C21383|nr:hypothetical protein [Moorena sp. SIO1G6]NET65096.1 hypothetical protein [Moorena sp. SIO1G6]
MENELMFFSQNPTNQGSDFYALGDKLLDSNRSEDEDNINTLVKRVFEIKSTGTIVEKLTDIEGILLNDEFVLTIPLSDLDNLRRKSSITCYGNLYEKDDYKEFNYEKIENNLEELEQKILHQTKIFAENISRKLPSDFEESENIKSILKKFYKKRKRKKNNFFKIYKNLLNIIVVIIIAIIIIICLAVPAM